MSHKEETDIQNRIMAELCKKGCKVFREQSGLFYTPYGERIRIGVEGKADLQGHRPSDGKCFYIEVKTRTGEKRKEQEKFIKAMQDSNALAGFARSVEDAIKIVFPEEKRSIVYCYGLFFIL